MHIPTRQPSTEPLTVTRVFLFTDVVSSTSLWEKDAYWMSVALEQHDRIVLAAVARHGGSVFSNAGDSFGVAFLGGVDALQAAAEIQRELAAVPSHRLTVRIGVHRGEAVARRGNLFGLDVSIAARLAACAAPGEVLVSDSIDERPSPFDSSAARAMHLDGVSQPVRARRMMLAKPAMAAAG